MRKSIYIAKIKLNKVAIILIRINLHFFSTVFYLTFGIITKRKKI